MGNIRRGIVTFTKAQCSASVATVADFALTIVLAKFCHMWYADATLLGAIFGGTITFKFDRIRLEEIPNGTACSLDGKGC